LIAPLPEARHADGHEELRQLDHPIPPLETTHEESSRTAYAASFAFDSASCSPQPSANAPRPRPILPETVGFGTVSAR
jgi:hypothetical protein